jgi:hypothetical protein
MKYKNTIITCNNEDEFIFAQKHLFSYKYTWITEDDVRHRHLQKFTRETYIRIDNDDELILLRFPAKHNQFFKQSTTNYIFIDCAKLIRKYKMKKISESKL